MGSSSDKPGPELHLIESRVESLSATWLNSDSNRVDIVLLGNPSMLQRWYFMDDAV
jgi:hypothetical protein